MRNVSALRWLGLGALLASGLIVSGCCPSCSEGDLGTMVYEVPTVPGSEVPFPLPKLDPEAAQAEEDETARESLPSLPPTDLLE